MLYVVVSSTVEELHHSSFSSPAAACSALRTPAVAAPARRQTTLFFSFQERSTLNPPFSLSLSLSPRGGVVCWCGKLSVHSPPFPSPIPAPAFLRGKDHVVQQLCWMERPVVGGEGGEAGVDAVAVMG